MNKLQELMESGLIWYDKDDMEYVGKASDGTEVSLGCVESEINTYLDHRPTPEQW